MFMTGPAATLVQSALHMFEAAAWHVCSLCTHYGVRYAALLGSISLTIPCQRTTCALEHTEEICSVQKNS